MRKMSSSSATVSLECTGPWQMPTSRRVLIVLFLCHAMYRSLANQVLYQQVQAGANLEEALARQKQADAEFERIQRLRGYL